MRIYKGDVGIELTIQAFLDLLEEDALEEAINLVLDMDAAHSLKEDYGGDFTYIGSFEINDDTLEELFEHIIENIENYEDVEEVDLLSMDEAKKNQTNEPLLSEEDLLDNLFLSNEDLRVKRIVKRFGHIN